MIELEEDFAKNEKNNLTKNPSNRNTIKKPQNTNTSTPKRQTTTTKSTFPLQISAKNSEENEEGLKDNAGGEDSGTRKLTDEECLEKIKELFPEDQSLTKTFITRKLKKRIAVYRKLNFNNEETFKGVENTIPKKTGPNSYLKLTIEVCNKHDFSVNSPLSCFMKDFFVNAYFIILKQKQKRMIINFAGQINIDLVSFLKKVSSEEFPNDYSVQTMKIKAYAFYEELVYEFSQKENISAKKINETELKDYVSKFNLLTKMRKAYDEIKLIKVDKN